MLQWDGEGWTPIDGAAPSETGNHDITPTSVSCTAPDDCMLLGNYRDSFDYPLTYAERWDGTAWSKVTMELSAFGSGTNGVACTSSTDCTAVGTHFPGHGGVETSVEHWDGTSWTVVTSPDPPTESPPGGGLTSVTCTGAGTCFAVGWWISDANTRTLIERFA